MLVHCRGCNCAVNVEEALAQAVCPYCRAVVTVRAAQEAGDDFEAGQVLGGEQDAQPGGDPEPETPFPNSRWVPLAIAGAAAAGLLLVAFAVVVLLARREDPAASLPAAAPPPGESQQIAPPTEEQRSAEPSQAAQDAASGSEEPAATPTTVLGEVPMSAETNQPPLVQPIREDQWVEAGGKSELTLKAIDPDGPANQLTFTLVNAPGWAKVDATTGKLTFSPTAAHAGNRFQLTARVMDNGKPAPCFAETTINLVVTEASKQLRAESEPVAESPGPAVPAPLWTSAPEATSPYPAEYPSSLGRPMAGFPEPAGYAPSKRASTPIETIPPVTTERNTASSASFDPREEIRYRLPQLHNLLYVVEHDAREGDKLIDDFEKGTESVVCLEYDNVTVYSRFTVSSPDGLTLSFYPDDALMNYLMYDNGTKDGTVRIWDPDGSLKYCGQYVKGKRSGFCCLLHDGVLRVAAEYKLGRLTAVYMVSDQGRIQSFKESQIDNDSAVRVALQELTDFEGELTKNETAFRDDLSKAAKEWRRTRATTRNLASRDRIQSRAAHRASLRNALTAGVRSLSTQAR